LGGLLLAGTTSCLPFLRGRVNDSPAIRWWLFSEYGAREVCPELLKRGAPLRFGGSGPSVGRFFPNRCHAQINQATHTMTLHFGGTGYAWTPIAGRIGFAASASVEYAPDFFLERDAIYVWGRTSRLVTPPVFELGSVEYKAVDWATRGTPLGYLAESFGQELGAGVLSQGFTVVRTRKGDDFTLGLLTPPARPVRPFATKRGKRATLANESAQVQAQQVDFLGPFEVVKGDQTLFMRFRHEGGPDLEAILYPQGPADVWREGLQLGAPLAPPPVAPILGFPIPAGAETAQRVKLPPGRYFVVLDNSSVIGGVTPPWSPLSSLGSQGATVSFLVELGDDRER
jgi:hypothetical protein